MTDDELIKTWITVAEAAIIAKRSVRTIYTWVDKGLLRSRTNELGQTIVMGKQVLSVEPTVRRGRKRHAV